MTYFRPLWYCHISRYNFLLLIARRQKVISEGFLPHLKKRLNPDLQLPQCSKLEVIVLVYLNQINICQDRCYNQLIQTYKCVLLSGPFQQAFLKNLQNTLYDTDSQTAPFIDTKLSTSPQPLTAIISYRRPEMTSYIISSNPCCCIQRCFKYYSSPVLPKTQMVSLQHQQRFFQNLYLLISRETQPSVKFLHLLFTYSHPIFQQSWGTVHTSYFPLSMFAYIDSCSSDRSFSLKGKTITCTALHYEIMWHYSHPFQHLPTYFHITILVFSIYLKAVIRQAVPKNLYPGIKIAALSRKNCENN